MNYEVQLEPEIFVVGISARTSNAASEEIGAVWSTPLERTYDADFQRHREDETVAIHVGAR